MSLTADLAINAGSSLVAGTVVWTVQTLRLRMRSSLVRRFLGFGDGERCLIVLNEHRGSESRDVVGHSDAQAAADAAALVAAVGGDPVVRPHGDVRALGEWSEICIGGPYSNRRTAAHLETFAPWFAMAPPSVDDPFGLSFEILGKAYGYSRGKFAHVMLLRVCPRGSRRAVWVVCGGTQVANRAGLVFLRREIVDLAKTHRRSATVVLMLKVRSADSYGADSVELVADLTDIVFESAK